MQQFQVNAAERPLLGTTASRRLRREGKVPAILYGAHKDPVSLELNHRELSLQLENEAFFSHILTIDTGKGAERAVLKDLQRHPYKPLILHADFQRIDENEEINMRVPVHFVNEDKCVGVKQDRGVISHLLTELEITCLPKDLPEYIAVDLADVPVGHTIHVGDLQLPAGVKATALLHGGDASQPVVSVYLPRAAAEGEEGGEAAEGETPAA